MCAYHTLSKHFDVLREEILCLACHLHAKFPCFANTTTLLKADGNSLLRVQRQSRLSRDVLLIAVVDVKGFGPPPGHVEDMNSVYIYIYKFDDSKFVLSIILWNHNCWLLISHNCWQDTTHQRNFDSHQPATYKTFAAHWTQQELAPRHLSAAPPAIPKC